MALQSPCHLRVRSVPGASLWDRQVIVTLNAEGSRSEEVAIICNQYLSGVQRFNSSWGGGQHAQHFYDEATSVHLAERYDIFCNCRDNNI